MTRLHPAVHGLVLLLAAAALPAHAALTRDDVRAALAEARASGDIVAPGDSGSTLREQRPDLFPAPPVPARTRADVIAELADAQRHGEMTHGDSGTDDAALHPGRYPARAALPGRTREQVRTELAQALRTGDIAVAGDSGLTLREQHPRRYASPASAPLVVSAGPAASVTR
jgi:hypothetical protein